MSNYDNNLSGALFKNDKGDNPKRPDYRGECEIEGVQYWISAWIKESQKGTKFMSLAFQAKDEAPKLAADDFDQDLPF